MTLLEAAVVAVFLASDAVVGYAFFRYLRR
jgi:hypothetical protein